MVVLLLIVLLGVINAQNFDVLSNIFFENLKSHPMIVGQDLNNVKQFIDAQISNYVSLSTSHESPSLKTKRSLLDKFTKADKGVYKLNAVTPVATIPVHFPEDIVLFQQNSHWFAAALESPEPKAKANYLLIYIFENGTFVEKLRTPIINGVKLATVRVSNSTLIAVAENDAPKSTYHEKSGIYQFDGDQIIRIQSIDMHYATDVAFWTIHDDVYLSVAHFGDRHEAKSPIYKWLGKHFDLVQSLTTKGVMKITPFTAKSGNFLAVANSRNEGNTRIYSDVYKYDYDSEKYRLHQRLLTKVCTDIQVFTLSNNHRQDTFLVVANSGNDSIIYKFMDDNFIPFQSIQEDTVELWSWVQNGVLFAATRYQGLKTFQYDGWAFKEVFIKSPVLKGIKSIHPSSFKNNTLVVVEKNNYGKKPNVFQLQFIHEQPLSAIYEDMITWCQSGLKTVEEIINSDSFDTVLGKPERADIDGEELFEENNELEARIGALNTELEQLGKDIKIPREIRAEVIVLNNVTFFDNLNTTTINGFPTKDLLDNILNIDDGFDVDQLNFDSMKTDNLTPKQINGEDPNTLLHTSDDMVLNSVSIRGSLTVPEGITINGTLNGISLNDSNLLQREGDQKFTRPLQVNTARVDRMVAGSLNGAPLRPDHIDTLRVTNLRIGGYLNDVDIPTLDKYALKRSGDQNVTSHCIFDVLQGRNLEVLGKLSDRRLSELIDIDGSRTSINQTLIFKNDLIVDNLQVFESFSGIEVQDGKLDILLKNSTQMQEITGDKIFDDVVIYHSIYLQGHINSENLEKMNPVVAIDQNIFLEGDKTITGHVEVENFLNVENVVTPGGVYSLLRVDKEGLRLSDKEVQPHLQFVQQLNVDEIFVDTVNGRNPGTFVVTGTEENQIIEGVKIFLGDLNITGATNALKINSVDVEELENKVLKIDGDQVVVGKHHVKHVVADRINTNVTTIHTNTTATQPSGNETLTLDDNLELDFVKAKTIFVKGLINDLPFDDIVNDTVFKNTNRLIGGQKYFKNLSVVNLKVDEGVPIDVPDRINELRLEGPQTIKNIKVDHIYFDDQCNGVSRADFDKDRNANTVHGDMVFDTVVVFGKAYIESKKINNVAINHLENDTVKVDEPHEFDVGVFESDVLSKSPILLDGHIENLDFDNLVLSGDNNLTIFDEKTFKNNVMVNGSVNFESYLNGLNMTVFSQFVNGQIEDTNLTINGSAFFAKGPKVAEINAVLVKDIKDRAWFRDEDTILSGSFDFEDLTFQNNIDVEGFVDNISLGFLYENYLSKTKDQNIPATFSFTKDLIFEHTVDVANITLSGTVNDVNLDQFVRSVLLDDYDQMFESVVSLENCHIQNLTGQFTVNSLDLDKDVMRYDKVNMVTGPKTIKNLDIDHLKLDKNIKIQNVDILDWFKNSVLRTTSFNITGNKGFRNAIFEHGFLVEGTLNGLKFDVDNIVVKDIPQDITASKTINTTPLNPVIFKNIKLKNSLNGVPLSELINNQAYKHQSNVFKTSLNLLNNITTNNLVIKKFHQGINMSELITNVTNLGLLNNLLQHYENLLKMSYKLKESFDNQAYFVHHYKIIQTIIPASHCQMILCTDGATRIGILTHDGTRMDLYGWDNHNQKFSTKTANSIHFEKQPKFIAQVFGGRYIYTETSDGKGSFNHMSNPADNSVSIFTNKTIHTTTFTLPITDEPCTLFIYESSMPRIFCDTGKQIKVLPTVFPRGYKASTITINGTLYLIIITQPFGDMEAHTDVWRLKNDSYFTLHQSLFEAHPKSVSTITHNGQHYLAIASGHLQNAKYTGRVEIRRFDETTLLFTPWQNLDLHTPIQAQFALLPSQELVLYVLTENPAEPFLVYRYEGIAGFKVKITESVLTEISSLNLFVGAADQHFIIAESYDEINIIQAVFKGEKVD